MSGDGRYRCAWCQGQFPEYQRYHDQEWGVPVKDDRVLFEFLILEGVQAGLSWSTVLKKRPHYRLVYDEFDPEKVAAYDEQKIHELLLDPGIIRNRLKVNASVKNARIFLDIQEEFGGFNRFLWDFVYGKPIQNTFQHIKEIPATSPISDKLSKELKKRGMSFVGSTIMYALMQGVGMVNDHETSCYRYAECSRLGESFAL